MQNAGAFFGVYAFTHFTAVTGRKVAFAVSFIVAMSATAFTFWNLKTFTDILWMIPLMGFSQLALFGCYAIYLPELSNSPPQHRYVVLPQRWTLRSCHGAACSRFAHTSQVYADKPEPMRYAGVTMCLVFLIGLATLPFAPETNGKPLPEIGDRH